MRLEIIDKLELLEEYITMLKDLQQYSLEEIEKNYVLRGAVERYLQVSLESMLDIGEIIISEEKVNALRLTRKYSAPLEKSVFFLKPLPEKSNLLLDLEMCSYICMQK